MTLTTPERLQVDGHDLKTLATNIETLAATLRGASKRMQNVTVAGKHGAFFVPRKKFDQLSLTWPMWVIGVDEDGNVPIGQTEREKFFENVDELIRIMHGEEFRQIEIRHTLPDGNVRIAYGEVVDTIDLTTSGNNPLGRVVFEVVLSDPFWREGAGITREFGLGTAWTPGTSWEIEELAGSNAPIEDAILEVYGPSDNLIIKTGPDLLVSTTIDGDGYDPLDILRIDSGTHVISKSSFTRELGRMNMSLNPSAETSVSGYSNAGSGVGTAPIRVSTGYTPSGSWFAQQDATGSGAFNTRLHNLDISTTNLMGYVVGRTYTWSVYIRLRSTSPSASVDFVHRAAFFTDVGFISSTTGTVVSVARATSDNTETGWYRISVSGTVPAGTTRVESNFFSGAVVLDDRVNFDAILVEESGSLNPFFHGSSPASYWTGSTNSSQSQKWDVERQNVHQNPSAELSTSGYSANGGVGSAPSRENSGVARSGTWYLRSTAGSSGIVNTLLHPATDAYFQNYEAGQEFTWSIFVQFAVGTDPDRSFEMKADFSDVGNFISGVTTGFVVVPLSDEVWTRLTLSGIIPAGATRVSWHLLTWGCVSGDEIRYDAAQIEPGGVATDYFDGDTPGARWRTFPHVGDSFFGVNGPPGPFVPITNFEYITHSGDSRYLYLSPDVDGKYHIGVDGSNSGSVGESKLVLYTARRFKTG